MKVYLELENKLDFDILNKCNKIYNFEKVFH